MGLIISGGGGGAAAPPFMKFISGNYYALVGNISSASPGVGWLTTVPFYTPSAITVDRIGCQVAATAASALIRLGVYSDSSGVPGSLLFDAGTVDASVSTGFKEITIAQTLPAGLCWFTALITGGAASVVRQGGAPFPPITDSVGANAVGANAGIGYALSGQTVFPGSYGSITGLQTGSATRVVVRKA